MGVEAPSKAKTTQRPGAPLPILDTPSPPTPAPRTPRFCQAKPSASPSHGIGVSVPLRGAGIQPGKGPARAPPSASDFRWIPSPLPEAGASRAGIPPPSEPQEAQRRREAPASERPRPQRARAGFGELPLVSASKVISVPRVGAGAEPPWDARGERPKPSGAIRREGGATSRPKGAPRVPPAMSPVFSAPGTGGSRPGQSRDPGPVMSAAPGALGLTGSRSERPAARREVTPDLRCCAGTVGLWVSATSWAAPGPVPAQIPSPPTLRAPQAKRAGSR